ncbi:MAG: DnaB-like helicase C-terminal domain-containing protein [bacterium]
MADGLRLYDSGQQDKLLDDSVHDARPTIPTGFGGLDSLLRRGGLLPGNLVLLGGRTGTRKTTVISNMAVSMAQANIPVAIVGLDEQPWQYVAKMMSALTGRSQDVLEEEWDTDLGGELRSEWKALAKGRVFVLGGKRPAPEHLTSVLDLAALGGERPAVVFIDYVKLMSRKGPYGYGDNSRIPQLVEDLQLWSTEHQVAVVALHQLNRNDEHGGQNSRNAGHIPMTLSQLMYGGEDSADIVLGTYRPSKNPLAAMQFDVAKQVLGDRFDEDEYWEVKAMAKKYEHSTFLQLLKNRPGTHTEERGIELLSPDESMRLEEKEAEEHTYEEADA